MRQKKSKIILKSTKFERIKIERCLELLICTVEGVWKEKESFQIKKIQENLEKWPESGYIKDLDEVVTIPIAEEIVQSEKRDLEDIEKKIQVSKINTMITVLLLDIRYITYMLMARMLVHHLYKKNSEEKFAAAIVSSDTKSSNIHDAVIARKKIEIQKCYI